MINPPKANPAARLGSIDAYRGFVMFLMMAEVLRLCSVSRALPNSGFWKWLCFHQSHVDWVGCSVHDLIQPSFSFLVGVALPFSIASRVFRGQRPAAMIAHAAVRSLILILLGVFLRSTDQNQTNWTFEDTLTQIGLGYGFLFFLGLRARWIQWGAFFVILFGYWLAFALYPVPPPEFAYADVGVDPAWLGEHGLKGFAAHWQKNSNLAWAFDRWWLNLFPRTAPFSHNGGGYATLSFIPTLATMILGLLAGGVLKKSESNRATLRFLLIAGASGLLLGLAGGGLGLCPIVKRIWTPTWVLYSGGWCFLLLGAFYLVVDVGRLGFLMKPLTVIGMNSIAAYCMAHLFESFVLKNLKTNLSPHFFDWAGPAYERFFQGAATLFILWLILLWMYRRKIFLRI